MPPADARSEIDPHRSMFAAFLIGFGLMAAIDEIIFHQILAWHHFFDRATPAIGLLSDGLLHSAELIILVAGFFMFSELRANHAVARTSVWAGLFLGLGGFQLFDGIIDHKILKLHQVRYVENLLPYDLVWNGFGLVLLFIGILLAKRASAERRRAVPVPDR